MAWKPNRRWQWSFRIPDISWLLGAACISLLGRFVARCKGQRSWRSCSFRPPRPALPCSASGFYMFSWFDDASDDASEMEVIGHVSISLIITPYLSFKKRSQNITGCWWWIINAHQSLQQYKGILMHLGWTSWRESDPLPTVAHEAWSQKDGPSSRRTWLRQRGWVTRTGTARNQAIEPALEGVSVNISWKNPGKWIVDFLGSFNSKIINRMGWYHPKWIQVHVWQWMGWPRWISNMKR